MLADRSVGYMLEEQTDKMVWPDLNLVPHLRHLTQFEYDCSNLRRALASGDKDYITRKLSVIKSNVLESSYTAKFFNRFLLEYDREVEALNKKGQIKGLSNLSEEGARLAENGFFTKHLEQKDIEKINKHLQSDINSLLNKKPTRDYRSYDRSIFYVQDSNTQLIDSILRESGCINAAEEYFSFSMKVYSVTLHISFPDDVHFNQVMSDKDYFPKACGLHFDPKSSTIKSILYLKNITEEDGPFTYLPKTHNLINPPLERLSAKANCTVNYLDSDEARASFMGLPSDMRKTSIFGTITDDSDELSKKILKEEKSFLSEDGNVIVFDPAMHHRGGICKSGHRISLQIAIRG
jgi:hypothetical protein